MKKYKYIGQSGLVPKLNGRYLNHGDTVDVNDDMANAMMEEGVIEPLVNSPVKKPKKEVIENDLPSAD